MKYKIFTATALAGGTFAALFGGWDKALQTLVIFMIVDWITGGILLPVVFGRSPNVPQTEHWKAEPDGKDFVVRR